VTVRPAMFGYAAVNADLVAIADPTHLEHLACLTGTDLRAASRYLRARILLLPATGGR
jgi:hypothetical protein